MVTKIAEHLTKGFYVIRMNIRSNEEKSFTKEDHYGRSMSHLF